MAKKIARGVKKLLILLQLKGECANFYMGSSRVVTHIPQQNKWECHSFSCSLEGDIEGKASSSPISPQLAWGDYLGNCWALA